MSKGKNIVKSIESFFNHVSSLAKYQIRPGLSRIKKIMKKLGNPEKKIKYAHIAGTNGKGSTSILLAEILNSKFKKVGLFTSPEIIIYNDRIKINGIPISDSSLIFYAEKIMNAVKHSGVYLTEFEFCTAIMFLYFADEKVDFAVIETGMGGRLDSTNIGKASVSIITSISYDHIEFLGPKLENILKEKFAIMKNADYGIVGRLNQSANKLAEKYIAENNFLSKKLSKYGWNYKILKKKNIVVFNNGIVSIDVSNIALFPEYQKYNLAAALEAACIILNENVKKININKILSKIEIPFRFQKMKNQENIYIDASHNVEGINYFIKAAKKINATKKIAVYSCYKDKDFISILRMLSSEFDGVYLYNLKHQRAADISGLADDKKIIFFGSAAEITQRIKKNKKFTYFVTGSYSTAREIAGLCAD